MKNEGGNDILIPFGGMSFAKKIVNSIKGSVDGVRANAGLIYDDLPKCEAMGEMCRSKINEDLRYLVPPEGCRIRTEKPAGQRYENVVIVGKNAILTVSRGYGADHIVKSSTFRRGLAANPMQMRLNLFDEDDEPYGMPGEPGKALILAWDISVEYGRPYVCCVELQEVVGSADNCIGKVDLLAVTGVDRDVTRNYICDNSLDVTVKPKERMMSANA